EAWITPEGWGEVGSNGYGRIADKNRLALYLSGHSTFGDSCLVFMLFTDSGGLSASMTPAGSITLGEWQHVAATYDAQSSTVTIYINGIAQPLEQTRPPLGAIVDNAAYDLFIGNAANLGVTFDGAIDEIRVWNIARTAEEIRSCLGACLPGPADGLVGYWPMNEGNGAEILDHSGQANHGAVSAAAWVQGTSFEVPAGADHDGVPSVGIHVIEAWPNPVAGSSRIAFDSPYAATVRLTISDLSGRHVRSLSPGGPAAGRCIATWDGCDDRGVRVPAGTYLISVDAGPHRATRRCIVLR
ncbi:MAG: hypothetical protein MUE60_11220, partial [Candidatus Eisenbacteria bacterium]|nr:hypothetical protein [Candidatus Eisenbacteria bacterium]